MYDDILVPTDGSDSARAALEHAIDIADHYDAAVHVICTVDPGNLERLPVEEDSRLRWARERVAEAVDVCSDVNVPVESSAEIGVAHETILEYAAEEGIDLIAMGTHGRTGLERYLLGSVAERVIRLADVPVLTVRATDEEPRYPYQNILVPTDGSAGAAAAYDYGIGLAATYGATLHAVSVVDEWSIRFGGRSESIRDLLEERAQSAVETVKDAAEAGGAGAINTDVLVGTPHRTLVRYVENHDVDLIVMGTHGRSGLDRYLLGSVTEKVVRISPVPVMTVRRRRNDG